MTSIKRLLALTSLSFFFVAFYPVLAVNEQSKKSVRDTVPSSSNNTCVLSQQVESAFLSLFDNDKPPGWASLKVDPTSNTQIWKENLKSCHSALVQKGVLKKLANLSVVSNGFSLNRVMYYIIREIGGWPFDDVMPILQHNKNYGILMECLDHSDWLINDTDSEFVKETFQLARRYYHPKTALTSLCSKMLEYKVIINGTEEAAMAFLAIDKSTEDRVKEIYLKSLKKQPLSPETKSNIVAQLIHSKLNDWAVMLIQKEGWPTPPNMELPKNK